LKYSEESEVYEEEKKMMMMMMMKMMTMMMGRRWRDNFKSDAKEINGAGT